jgi:hypothetical protein
MIRAVPALTFPKRSRLSHGIANFHFLHRTGRLGRERSRGVENWRQKRFALVPGDEVERIELPG